MTVCKRLHLHGIVTGYGALTSLRVPAVSYTYYDEPGLLVQTAFASAEQREVFGGHTVLHAALQLSPFRAWYVTIYAMRNTKWSLAIG